MTGGNFSLTLSKRLKGSDNEFNLQGETTFLEENFSFLSTGSFYQTLRKFNQQTFRKSLTKNAAQASQKESVEEAKRKGFYYKTL